MKGDNFSVIPLFSKPLFTSTCEPSREIKARLKIHIDKSDWHINKNNTPVTTQRTKNLNILNEDDLLPLKLSIIEKFNYFKNEIMQYKGNDFELTTSWITATHRYNYSNYHNHSNTMYTGVLYFDQQPNQGGISFMDFTPRHYQINVEENNIYNSKEWIVEPAPWQIMFFPSSVYHRIMENMCPVSRYSLAFCFHPVGDIGSGDSHIKFKKVGNDYGIS